MRCRQCVGVTGVGGYPMEESEPAALDPERAPRDPINRTLKSGKADAGSPAKEAVSELNRARVTVVDYTEVLGQVSCVASASRASFQLRRVVRKFECLIVLRERLSASHRSDIDGSLSARARFHHPRCHRRAPARAQEGTGRSSIRSRSEERNRYYGPWHGAPAHWARPGLERTGRCSTEVRWLSASRTD